MKIDFANLGQQYQTYKKEIDSNLKKVLEASSYILGPEIQELEEQLEKFTGAKNCITCSSGTDALTLAMMCSDIGDGDEVITTPFSYVATADTIALLRAKPVFVDIEPNTFNIDPSKIEQAVTSKTKAIIPVSLFGQPSDLDEITKIAATNNLKVIIDGAQSFGSTYNNVSDSTLGDFSTTSFFPAKPLGCYGDGGAVFTNNLDYSEKLKKLRVHGQEKRYHHRYLGLGARLDTIQAAILLVKLKYYKSEIEKRQEVASLYTELFSHNGNIQTPVLGTKNTSVWAQYTLRVKDRERLQTNLSQLGIPTAVHYPKSLHEQECFGYLKYNKLSFPETERACEEVLSLPLNPFLTVNEVEFIAENVNELTMLQ